MPEGIWPGQKCSKGSWIVSKRHRNWNAAVSACRNAHEWGPASWEQPCKVPSWTLRNICHAIPHHLMCKAGLVMCSVSIKLSPLEKTAKENITTSLTASPKAGLKTHTLSPVWSWPTQFCAAQPNKKAASFFWEVARKVFLHPTMTLCLLVIQALLIALFLYGRLRQDNIISWGIFILAVHCPHASFRRRCVESTFSHTLPMQFRSSCHLCGCLQTFPFISCISGVLRIGKICYHNRVIPF